MKRRYKFLLFSLLVLTMQTASFFAEAQIKQVSSESLAVRDRNEFCGNPGKQAHAIATIAKNESDPDVQSFMHLMAEANRLQDDYTAYISGAESLNELNQRIAQMCKLLQARDREALKPSSPFPTQGGWSCTQTGTNAPECTGSWF